MAAGKRLSTDQPLTEHDIADRLDRAALRLLRIMWDARQLGLMDPVRGSRYFTNVCGALQAELEAWGVEPAPLDEQQVPDDLPPTALIEAITKAYHLARCKQPDECSADCPHRMPVDLAVAVHKAVVVHEAVIGQSTTVTGPPGHFEDCPRYQEADLYVLDWCDCGQRRAEGEIPPEPRVRPA